MSVKDRWKKRNVAVLVEKSRDYGRELLKGISEYVRTEKCGWTLSILTPDHLSGRAVLGKFDGVIARINDGLFRRRLVASGVPAVDVFNEKPCPGVIGVDSDHAGIGRAAAQFFLERGHRTFAFCGYSGVGFSLVRARAYADCLAERGFTCDTYNLSDSRMREFLFDERNMTTRISDSLDEWVRALPSPVAVFCANDFLAYALSNSVLRQKRRVPEDVSILGVDNDELVCSFAPVSLSSIDPAAHAVGRNAARLLAAAMRRPADLKRPHKPYFVRSRGVIERTSTDFRPVGPPWMPGVLSFIDRNLDAPVTLDDLVRESGYSQTTIVKTFHAVFGVTPVRYILDQKMRLAQRLLESGEYLCKQVCFMTGFSSAAHFSRVYRTYFGHTARPIARERRAH